MTRIDERLLAGEPVPEEPELTALVSAVRSLADAPAPLPNPALVQVLRDGMPADPPASLDRRRRSRRSTLFRITIGATVAAAAATGAAALELPESLQEPARSFFSDVADFFTPGEQSEPPPERPQPHPEPLTETEPVEPAEGPQVDEGSPREPASRPDEDKRPETPANPASPQPPGNPDVNPGPPDNPGPPIEPGPPADPGRPGTSQLPGENPYPKPGRPR